MVVAKTLNDIDNTTLCRVFNEAFSDYQIEVKEAESVFVARNIRNGFKPDSSIGLFDENQLVGFILVGIRNNFAYDGATGIIPSYRGKGYSHLLIDSTLEHLRIEGREAFVLEVLDSNTKAKQLYEHSGFKTQRTLNCYSIEKNKLEQPSDIKLEITERNPNYEEECIPSWQNSKEAIAAADLRKCDIILGKELKGYVYFDINSGSVAQLYILPSERRNGIATQTLYAVAAQCQSENIRFINIDASYTPMTSWLNHMNFDHFLTQSEMRLEL